MKSRMSMVAGLLMMGLALSSVGCYAEAGTYVATQSDVVYTDSPTLVAVEPGIWVVSHQPTAIYYVNDSYWTCRGNTWYRSSDWNGGWVTADVRIVPTVIVHRDSTRYVYYDPPRHATTRRIPPGHRETPGVRRGQTYGHTHARHNEVGSTWSRDERPSKHTHPSRGRGRGR